MELQPFRQYLTSARSSLDLWPRSEAKSASTNSPPKRRSTINKMSRFNILIFLSYQRNVPTFPYNLNYLTRSKRSLSTWRSVCPQRARCDRPALWTMMSSWNPTNYKLVTNYINLPFWQAIELIWKFRLKICHLTITMNYYYEIIFRWNESSMMCFSQKFKNAVKLKSHFLARKLKFRIL